MIVFTLATGNIPNWLDGIILILIGSGLLCLSIVEILHNKRRFARFIAKMAAWIGRGFAIMVWLLMIVAGVKFLSW